MDTSSSKTKFSLLWALDVSKGILLLIYIIAGIKILLDPEDDPIKVILWRLTEISLLVIPGIILCSFIYALFNYDCLLASEIEYKKNSKSK